MAGLFLPGVLDGCAHYPLNAPLAASSSATGYRFANFPPTADNDDELFIIISFSGGGARAAAYSYGLLEALHRTPIRVKGRDCSLLSQVDVISSVSGSSFTAAYYALHHDETFTTFPALFLNRDVQGELIAAAANPLNWPRLASPTFDRIDLAAEYYDREVFDRRTYGDLLAAPRRPYLLLNATDVSLGTRFEFSQEQFDCLYSDLASVPLARAVAASAAFPVVFSPIAFENHPAGPGHHEPSWIESTLHDPDASPRVLRRAADLRSYADKPNRAHVRLLDGAIADYMGLRGPLQAFISRHGDFSLRRMLDDGRIRRLVIISANAVRTPPIEWDVQVQAPGWYDMLYLTASAPIRNYAYDTVTLFQDLLTADAAVKQAAPAVVQGSAIPSPAPYERYFIVVDFAHVPDIALRQRLEATQTSLTLTATQVDNLCQGAEEALRASPDLARLLTSLRSDRQ